MMHIAQQRPYPVVVGDGMTPSDWQRLLPAASASRWLLVTDTNTAQVCQPILQQLLPVHDVWQTVVPAGESYKHIDTVEYIWQQWQQALVGRDAHVLLLGGGVVGDLGAFAAATYGRGLPVTQVPTSLLAMVDASIGGKTGINFGGIKNIVGTFTPPHQVIIDRRWLQTLPVREYRSALGEVLKYGLLQGGTLWQLLQRGITSVSQEVITTCVKSKLSIVRKDPKDNGVRQLLNLGHTFGHALEAWSHTGHTPLWHGEAVAVGLVYAVALSAETGLMPAPLAADAIQTIRGYFTEITLNGIEWQQLQPYLLHDKKKKGNELRWVLPVQPGQVRYGVAVPDVALLEAAFHHTKAIFTQQ